MDAVLKGEIRRILQSGTMDIEGVLPWSSNYAFLVTVCEGDVELPAVYKPRRGERPLWDFPQGTLSLREQAAFEVSNELGWDLVPPTVLREGRHGPGSVQLFIAHDPEQHYFSFQGDPIYRLPLQKMALMDIAINNADRKGGHVIIEHNPDEAAEALAEPAQLWGIDHGICFHVDNKLRTVIWEFAGTPIPPALLADLQTLRLSLEDPGSRIRENLVPVLSHNEIAALTRRVRFLIDSGEFPKPGPGRHYPWPPV